MATILITGGTGLIGTALKNELIKKGYYVIILTREIPAHKYKSKHQNLSFAKWNIDKQYIDADAIKKADHIIHLAGANVAEGRWTAKRKKEIVDSRVQSGKLIVKALNEIPNKVQSVISASAIGWYGPDAQIPNPQPFVETDIAANDFLGTTCKQWEAAIRPVDRFGKTTWLYCVPELF